jgi:hypothetical protein
MKNLLKFMGVLIGIFFWGMLINISFNLMTEPNTFLFLIGILLFGFTTMGPIMYFEDNIVMFLKNMKSIFFDKEKK